MAYDVVGYDQEGCFSMQEAFVQDGIDQLVPALERALESYGESFPRRALTPDAEAIIQRARMEAVAEGWEIYGPDTTDWTIVVTDGPAPIVEHPLSRVIYVHPVSDAAEVLPTINRDVQTVALEPWDRLWGLADPLTAAGVDRIVQVAAWRASGPASSTTAFIRCAGWSGGWRSSVGSSRSTAS